jgi:hypothetical protein
MSTGQPVTRARKAWRELAAGNVVDASGGHELAGDREIAGAAARGDGTPLIDRAGVAEAAIMEGEARHE